MTHSWELSFQRIPENGILLPTLARYVHLTYITGTEQVEIKFEQVVIEFYTHSTQKLVFWNECEQQPATSNLFRAYLYW